jgi:hypothetical protein
VDYLLLYAINKLPWNPMKLLPVISRLTILAATSVLQMAAAAAAAAAAAPPSAKFLAVDSYMFLETTEILLASVLRSADQVDYNRYVWASTQEQLRKWPKDGAAAREYSHCHQALTAFQTYSKDQFKARGSLKESSPTARPYFDLKLACKRSVNF